MAAAVRNRLWGRLGAKVAFFLVEDAGDFVQCVCVLTRAKSRPCVCVRAGINVGQVGRCPGTTVQVRRAVRITTVCHSRKPLFQRGSCESSDPGHYPVSPGKRRGGPPDDPSLFLRMPPRLLACHRVVHCHHRFSLGGRCWCRERTGEDTGWCWCGRMPREEPR